MNFKIFSLTTLLISLCACGVKTDPIPPEGSKIKDYISPYTTPVSFPNDKK